ncbi:MAG: VWA domain-containing protein, partial [Planctomycetes bacterium]|nr:VWA domain-containing protein [Planctomycetota bacterium]
VVDCSASMIVAFEYIQRELKRTVESLTPAQYFHIILYAAGEPIEMSPVRLMRANAPRRKEALDFINQMKLVTVADTREGSDAVVVALGHAFEVTSNDSRPAELIYLLTDGQFDHQKVDELVRQKQTGRTSPARINVIACGNRNNEEFLKTMAAAYQGEYRFVSDAELAKIRK